MGKIIKFKIESNDQGKRLDKFLSEKLKEYSRAEIQKMIKEKNILINAKETKSSYKIKIGDIIEIRPPEEKIDLSPNPSIKIAIVHDEKDFAIIDKPAGLVVYPGTKHKEKTLVSGLLSKWPEIKSVGDPPVGGLRPGIVHRLDKDTSGLMVIAKNNETLNYFKDLFKNREVEKTYIALVHGRLEPKKGVINLPIRRSKTNPVKQVAVIKKAEIAEARPAVTEFRVLNYYIDKNNEQYTLVEAKPKTGRMHQIRVHFAALNHSVAGDKIYTQDIKKEPATLKSHFLHAARLEFPYHSEKKLEFYSPLPKDLKNYLESLKTITLPN